MKKHIIIILISTIILYSCNKELSYGEQLVKEGKVSHTIETRSYRADVISGKYVKSESNNFAFNLYANIAINEDFREGKVYFDRYNNILFIDGFGSKVNQYSNPSQHELMKVQNKGMFGNSEYIYVRDEYGTLIEEKEINNQGIVQFSKKYFYDDYNRLFKAIIHKYDRKYITEYGSTQKGNGLIDNIERTTSYLSDGRLMTTILYKTINKRSNKLESIYKEVYIENELDIKKTISYEYDFFYGTIKKESFYGWKHNGVAVFKNNSNALIPSIDHYKDQIEQYIMSFDQYGNPIKYRTILEGNTKPRALNQLTDRDISNNFRELIKILQFDCKYYYVGDVWVKAELSLLIRSGETEYYIIERDIEYH